MARKGKAAPDPSQVAEIRNMIASPKTWVAAGEMEWVDAGGLPKGFRFRERLALPTGAQPATLFVEAYFKPAGIRGAADKLSLNLCFHNARVLSVDEDGPGSHLNSVGKGRPYFGKRIGFPHVHTISDDSIDGYAEPLDRLSFGQLWDYFVNAAGITGAPPFQLPTQQLGLPL